MDVSETIEPNSQQINAEDLLTGPRTVTITGVEAGTKDQPVFIHLAEFPGRTYRPAKIMRRLLVTAWGPDGAAYVGRKLTIYNDPHVKWGGEEVGGIRIKALSHIPEALHVPLSVSRGKRQTHEVVPLKTEDTSGRDWLKELALADGDRDAILTLGRAAKKAFADPQILKVMASAYENAKDTNA